jgi:hypothetical protein
MDAGVQGGPTVTIADRINWYKSHISRDRDGNIEPIRGLTTNLVENSFGIDVTFKVPFGAFYSASASMPLSHASANSDDPFSDVDTFGLGDFYLKPLQLGWRLGRFDALTSYGVYIPTGLAEVAGGKGLSEGQWTHQFSLGGAVFADRERSWKASALISYNHDQKKNQIDITRGETVIIEGGAGVRAWKVLDLGIAGYALWQVRDDRGADLPEPLRGAREQVFGLGPEAALSLPQIRSKLTARYEWDLGALSHPQGRLLSVAFEFQAWAPKMDP